MNRILYVGRMAKGLSEEQMAKVLQIEVGDYKSLEHSLTDITAQQALKLSKVFGIDAEVFIYTEGREARLLKYAADEINGYLKNGLLDGMSPNHLFSVTSIANTALSLSVQLSHAIYKQYELEKDNEAIRKLNDELQQQLEGKR